PSRSVNFASSAGTTALGIFAATAGLGATGGAASPCGAPSPNQAPPEDFELSELAATVELPVEQAPRMMARAATVQRFIFLSQSRPVLGRRLSESEVIETAGPAQSPKLPENRYDEEGPPPRPQLGQRLAPHVRHRYIGPRFRPAIPAGD